MNDKSQQIVDNPKASPITRAYFDAQKPLGGLPETARETSLFEALQDALQKRYDGESHARCKELEADLRDEIADYEREEVRKLYVDEDEVPEPVNLVAAKRIVEDRRRAEPIGSVHNHAYDAIRRERDATDLLEALVAEVEHWRKIVVEKQAT